MAKRGGIEEISLSVALRRQLSQRASLSQLFNLMALSGRARMYVQNSNEFDLLFIVAFVLREARKWGQSRFDAEDVIDQSSPYKRTAERSSAANKPHKMEKTVSNGFHPQKNICSVWRSVLKWRGFQLRISKMPRQ